MGCCDILNELECRLREAIEGCVNRAVTGTMARDARRVESAARWRQAMVALEIYIREDAISTIACTYVLFKVEIR
jgi:hypothetical protein